MRLSFALFAFGLVHVFALPRKTLFKEQRCASDDKWRGAPETPVAIVHTTSIFEIKHWTARAGNNFVQILNVVSLAACCRGVAVLPPHPAWPRLSTRVDYSNLPVAMSPNANASRCVTDHEPSDVHAYAYTYHLPKHIGEALFQCTFDVHKAVLAVLFDEAPGCVTTCSHIGADTLVVHIRSGDVFVYVNNSPGDGALGYLQFPVVFYATVLSSRHWRRVLFVTEPVEMESAYNPVFLHFRNVANQAAWPKTVFEFRDYGTMDSDTAIFRCSTNFVPAHSSFSYYVLATSQALQTYYVPTGWRCMSYNSRCDGVRSGVKKVSIPIPDWNLDAPWHNTPEERRRLVTHGTRGINIYVA